MTNSETNHCSNSDVINNGVCGVEHEPLLYDELYDCDPPDYGYRQKLPHIMIQRSQVSVWSILKHSIGKELSKITMPVYFNEPLSFLQRLTEYMEYAYLIGRASESDDPVKRLEYVAAFAVSALASNWERLGKPFNPLLGETFELDRSNDQGFRIICEQVSHHPPVSAFHADSPLFRFYGSIYPKLRFWGRSVEIQPKGQITLELLKHSETYTWSNVSCSVHNLMMGKLWIEQHGVMEITCRKSALKCVLNFKPSSQWFGKDTNHIEGFIQNTSKERLRAMYGVWTDSLSSCDVSTFDQMFAQWDREPKGRNQWRDSGLHRAASDTSSTSINSNSAASDEHANHAQVRTLHSNNNMHSMDGANGCAAPAYSIPLLPNSQILWKVHPRPATSEQFYQFTSFAMMLNELDPDVHKDLPPTDSRLRPDIRWMEEGDIEKASDEKTRLEEKQREGRNMRKKAKSSDWSPLWFKSVKRPGQDETWEYSNEYWNKEWAKCPDIF